MADSSDAGAAQEQEETGLRVITEEQLRNTLDAHELWISSGKKEGARADLSHVNLSGVNLNMPNLQEANLQKVRNLTQQQLDEACGDEHTKLPDGLTIKRRSETKKNEKKGLEKRKNEP